MQRGVRMSDEEIVGKLNRLKAAYTTLFDMKQKDAGAKRRPRNKGRARDADFEDLPAKVRIFRNISV